MFVRSYWVKLLIKADGHAQKQYQTTIIYRSINSQSCYFKNGVTYAVCVPVAVYKDEARAWLNPTKGSK